MSSHLGASRHMLLGSPHGFISCKLDQPPFHPLHGKGLAQLGHLNSNNPFSRWKKGLRAQVPFAVAAVATALPAEKAPHHLQEEEEEEEEEEERENITSDGRMESDLVVPADGEKLDYKERIRRMRIGKANRGKVPWNKGRKHSPETLERIRERTKQAMKNPKIRQKLVLAQCSRSQSKETKERIRVALKRGWEGRCEKFLLQRTCIIEWKEAIAEAARGGGDCEEELLWDSYKILKEKMHQEWLQDVAMRKAIAKEKDGCKRACKSAEQRLKISEAIRAKWADPDYRKNVQIGMKRASANKRSNTLERLKERKVVMVSKITKRERAPKLRKMTPNQSPVTSKLNELSVPSLTQKKLPPPYSDPLAGAKLQMIKQIRVNRAAMELKKQEATERARLLIAEAEKAAKALEAAAVTDAKAQVFLSEIRRLLDEAAHSMQSAESGRGLDAPLLQRSFARSAHTETLHSHHLIDSSEIASAAVIVPADRDGPQHLSLSKTRELEENKSLRFKEESPLNGRLARSMSHGAYQQRCSISMPETESAKLQNSVNSSLLADKPITGNTILEKMPDGVVRENSMLRIAMTSAGLSASCMVDAAWKHKARPVENIRKDIVPYVDINSFGSSLVNDEYSTQNISRKSEARPAPKGKDGAFSTEKKIKRKWVRGRLVVVKDD